MTMCVSRKQRNILHKIKHRGFVYVKKYKMLLIKDKKSVNTAHTNVRPYVEKITNEQPACVDSMRMIMELVKLPESLTQYCLAL